MSSRSALVRCLVPALLCVHQLGAVPLSSRVGEQNGRMMVFLNGRPEIPVVYALTDVPGGRWSWEDLPRHNIRQFANAGVRLYQVDLFLDHLWMEDGRIDITLAQRQIAGIVEVCPEAGVFIRLHVSPPRWWTRKHPEEWVKYADVGYMDESDEGFPRIIEEDNFPVRRVSMASALWRLEAGSALSAILQALSRTPEGNSLAGIQVAGGIYGEWHNWGFYRNEPDTCAPMQEHFRAWLKERYGTEAALRVAWRREGTTFVGARVPSMEERRTLRGVFRDPEREMQAIDYYRCVHELVADNILWFARIVKETWPRPIVVGTFYGYYFSTFGRQAAGGHLELRRVLDSPHIDYLSGPQAYEPEATKLGDPYRSRSLIATVRLHRKLWLDEMDAEPTIPVPRDPRYELHLRNAIAAVRRNMAFTLTKGMGLWFYDFGVGGVDLDGFRANTRGSRGTWDHSVLLAEVAAAKKLFEDRSQTNYRSGADVLFVYDTESYYHTASLRGSDPVSTAIVDHASLAAFRSGVVFDPIHLWDLDRIDLTPYRTVVFGNTFVLNDTQRRYIRDHVARDNRTIVWMYAPGYSDGKTLEIERISDLTGIRVKYCRPGTKPAVTVRVDGDSAVTYALADTLSPLFTVEDPRAVVLGNYEGTGEPALAKRSFADHTSWYIALPGRTPEPLRTILRGGGAHVYGSQGEIVYSGGGVLAVHVREGGKHTITLRSGRQVTFDLPEGASTLLLDPESGEPLLRVPQAR
jgi:hypothetical protein